MMLPWLLQYSAEVRKNNLSKDDWQDTLEILKDNGYDENVRAEDISYETFVKIFNKLDSNI